MIKTNFAFLVALCTSVMAQAEAPLSFTSKLISKSPYQLQFTPPSGHHFNLDAPTHVELASGDQGTLEKDPHKVIAKFGGEAKLDGACIVKASLYVCNDANTYCRPVKQDLDCQTLTTKK